jgi:dienelactone hydrolase
LDDHTLDEAMEMYRTTFSLCLLVVLVRSAFATEPLPGTEPLEWTDPIDVRMMRHAHEFVEQKIDESVSRLANRQPLNPAELQAKRERLKFIVGAGGREREPHSHLAFPAYQSPVRMERISDDDLAAIVFEDELIRISRVQWPVYDGVTGEGILLEPLESTEAQVVVVPDADQSPEMLAGLVEGIPPENQIARRLAASGASVIVPVLINRHEVSSTKPLGISNREWIYRQAFHMGRHVIGYEIDKIVAAVDWFEKTNDSKRPIGITGWGEGERLAKYAMAIDNRIDAALLSGKHSETVAAWREPIYRNVWSIASEWNEAAFQELVAPRAVVLEERQDPVIDEKRDKASFLERRDSASDVAYGETATIDFCSKIKLLLRASNASLIAPRNDLAPFIAERHLRQLKQLDDYTQRLARESEPIREEFYLNKALPKLGERKWSTESFHETTPVSEFTAHADRYRRLFWNEVIGKFDDSLIAPNPRARFIRDTESWAAHEVVLDVVPGLFAWGILMMPKDIAAGEKRPVVVVQHGRGGLPEDILNGGYNEVAQKLTDRGYIVFAPHNLYRGEDEYRWLDRKANSIGKSLFSFLLLQHDQITRWLERLPQVDGNRIAFYGNSYGGESAVRIPTVLTRYALSICASDFNDWTRKVTDTHDKHSFMRTIEWEMPYFNMGNTFSYAELAYLMVPRPFMVERGHHDLVAPDHWVASEYSKVRLVYDQLGIGDRTAITFFQGGHTMRGEETIEFIDRHFR